MKRITTIYLMLFVLLGYTNFVYSQDVVDASTLNNKIMAGYQGWFGAPNDGSGYGWIHWGDGGGNINAESVTIDMWPDMREYDADELFATDFVYKDLTNAGLFSSYTKKTVDRHVKWMKDYGIDGVFVQRFISSALSRTKQRDTVLCNVMHGAENHGRVFANMYDMSGGKPASFVEDVKGDWMHIVDDLKVTESPNYLHHNGLPVLSLWGVHVGNTADNLTPAQWVELLEWFTVGAPEKYRVTLKAGVNNSWKEDSQEWQAVYDYFEFISPWSVGRYNNNSTADNFRNTYFEADLNETASRGMGYIPVVFPGFSWANLYEGKELNQIPRNGGNFLWRQFYNAIDAGCNMVYVAMFDEVDEGTAIFKTTENASQNPTTGKFVTLDMDGYKLPSDWYLRLTGEATKMLRGEISKTDIIPIVAYPSNAAFISQEVPTTMSPGAIQSVEITMKNTGTEMWTKIDGYKLMSSVSSTTLEWGISEVGLADNESIASNASKTFTFDITAPASEGVYKFQWRMRQNGVDWIGDASTERLINVANNIKYFDDCDALSNWNSSSSLTINTTDDKQGTGCIEFNGATELNKVLATSYNSGITAFDAVLQFWYYTSDASINNGVKVGLGSAGVAGANEFTWTVSNLTTGWNLIKLNVSNAVVKGTPDMNAINWFSLTNTKNGVLSNRIDEIQIFDKYAGKTRFDLVVNNGAGSGKYVEDDIVPISANEAPVGKEFIGWKAISGKVLFENARSMNTTLRVFTENIEIVAEYKVLGEYLDDCDDMNGWGSSAVLVLNTIDQKEGNGCVEFSGSAVDEFKKVFSPAYNSGATVETGRLEFWYYTSDALAMGNNQVEIGSAGRPDQSEYSWTLTGLVNGWNRISLSFTNAGILDIAPNLNALNWFRIYNFKSSSVVTRIDAIEIVDPNGGVKHTLTVKRGTGDGNYFKGTIVSISAEYGVNGEIFDKWVIEEGSPLIANVNASNTALTMGEGDAIVSATYKVVKSYVLKVNNGTGDGTYKPGATPVITADAAPANSVFDKWLVNSGTITLSDEKATLTYFTMPEEDVEVTATYKSLVSIDFSEQHSINIYPNPAKKEVTIEFALEKLSDIGLAILDLSGRVIAECTTTKTMSAGDHQIKLPVSVIRSGTYLVSLRIDNVVVNKILVIQ